MISIFRDLDDLWGCSHIEQGEKKRQRRRKKEEARGEMGSNLSRAFGTSLPHSLEERKKVFFFVFVFLFFLFSFCSVFLERRD